MLRLAQLQRQSQSITPTQHTIHHMLPATASRVPALCCALLTLLHPDPHTQLQCMIHQGQQMTRLLYRPPHSTHTFRPLSYSLQARATFGCQHPALYNPRRKSARKTLQPRCPCQKHWSVLTPAPCCCMLHIVLNNHRQSCSVVALDLLQQPQEVQEQVDNVLQAHKVDMARRIYTSAMQIISENPKSDAARHTICAAAAACVLVSYVSLYHTLMSELLIWCTVAKSAHKQWNQ
jgi:hypothetical protein